MDSTTASALIAANANGIARPVSPYTAAGMITAAGFSSGSVPTGNSSMSNSSGGVSSSTAAAVSAAAAQLQQHYATVAASAGGKA